MRRTHSWNTRLLVLVAALLVLAALAGCGSRSKEAPTEAPPPTDTAAPQPTQEPAAAESVDADATATAEAQLAAVGEGGGEAEATEAPAEEPPAEPTEALAEPAGGGEAITQGACNHPYFPIRDGAVYRYQMTAPEMTDTEMTIQYRVMGPDSFVTTQTFAGITTETEWKCTDEGLLQTSFGLTGLDMPGIEYNVSGVSGVTFPLPDQLQMGGTWQSQYSMSGEIAAEGFAMKIDITATMDNVLTAFEPVTTPAGTFDAAKVDTTTAIEVKTDAGPMPALPGMTTSSTVWYAEGVGMVKSVSDDASGKTVLELVAME